MLKLRHLFDNPALAQMLLENWEHEPEWMVALRLKLAEICRKDAEFFGQPVRL
jgi:hypothetical protein